MSMIDTCPRPGAYGRGSWDNGDLKAAYNSTDVCDVWLEDIDTACFEKGSDVPPAVEPLAQGNGDTGHLGYGLDPG